MSIQDLLPQQKETEGTLDAACESLGDKIAQVAELVDGLRAENAIQRKENALLRQQYSELRRSADMALRRIDALVERFDIANAIDDDSADKLAVSGENGQETATRDATDYSNKQSAEVEPNKQEDKRFDLRTDWSQQDFLP